MDCPNVSHKIGSVAVYIPWCQVPLTPYKADTHKSSRSQEERKTNCIVVFLTERDITFVAEEIPILQGMVEESLCSASRHIASNSRSNARHQRLRTTIPGSLKPRSARERWALLTPVFFSTSRSVNPWNSRWCFNRDKKRRRYASSGSFDPNEPELAESGKRDTPAC